MEQARAACVVVLVLGLAVAGQRTSPEDISYGDHCEESSQCSPFGSGAVCQERRCVCDEQFFFNNTRCLYKRGLGETCNRTEFGCYLKIGGHLNAICENGICACASGFVPNTKTGECLQAAHSFGDVCEMHNQCSPLGAGSRCKEGKCMCEGDSFFDGSKCLYKKVLGEFCNTPEFGCYMEQDMEAIECVGGICACVEGFVRSKYPRKNNTCVKLSTYEASCTEHVQCSYFGGLCRGYHLCSCNSLSFYNGSRCLTIKDLDADCSGSDVGCYIDDLRGGPKSVVCRSGRCDCADGFTNVGNYRCNFSDGGQQLSLSLLTLLVAIGTSFKATRLYF